ncbi:hypothetical protein FF38_10084 [Lucilia cuprina]|uniref:Uncharacterized protein n=1 Tax=Lucilia cuprina TaxID=7375 RepID=A0A0L0CHH2_LUCCU|nr:hypothetical protein FF38_10084 [Lucilia cuprina]
MTELFERFCTEQREQLHQFRSESFRNNNTTDLNNTTFDKRLNDLEMYNNILQSRLNRADIIVKGLPKHIKNLRVPILKIASLCGLPISHDGIQHCTYINNGRAVLVKLNSVQHRDKIMMNYSKKQHIVLKDIIGGDITSKVFLSDHLTRVAANLISICRDLRIENKILKYKFINADTPKVRVTLPDNNVKILCLQQCSVMLNEALSADNVACGPPVNCYGTQNDIGWDPLMLSASTVRESSIHNSQPYSNGHMDNT